MIVELNSRLQSKPEGDEQLTDMVMSLYLSAVVSAGYQLMPDDAQDFAERVGRMVGSGLEVAADAELAPELEIADEPDDADSEEAEDEEADDDGDAAAPNKDEV